MSNTADFLLSNKLTTDTYRHKLALAVAQSGTVPIINKMVFGTGGLTDSQGNPLPPTTDGPLNSPVLTKDFDSVTVGTNSVTFVATINPTDNVTVTINEVGLLDETGDTAAKMRLLTGKGLDPESSIQFEWVMDF